jgi:hypothetical protein
MIWLMVLDSQPTRTNIADANTIAKSNFAFLGRMLFLLPREAETRLAALNYQMQTVTIRSDGDPTPDVVWSLVKDLSSGRKPLRGSRPQKTFCASQVLMVK